MKTRPPHKLHPYAFNQLIQYAFLLKRYIEKLCSVGADAEFKSTIAFNNLLY